jgi:hypothetical protein
MNIEEILTKIYKCPDPKKAKLRVPNDLIIDTGSRRLVTEHPKRNDLVIKFGVGVGIEHNKNEFKIYKKAKSENVEEILCPIENNHPDYKWISVPYIKNIQKDSEKKLCGPKAYDIHNKLNDIGIDLYEIETAYHKGRPIAYDYGQII